MKLYRLNRKLPMFYPFQRMIIHILKPDIKVLLGKTILLYDIAMIL